MINKFTSKKSDFHKDIFIFGIMKRLHLFEFEDQESHEWEIGKTIKVPGQILYLLGYPKNNG